MALLLTTNLIAYTVFVLLSLNTFENKNQAISLVISYIVFLLAFYCQKKFEKSFIVKLFIIILAKLF